jgi:predicted phosphoadenosine phosphosulfate sulfurtransferase
MTNLVLEEAKKRSKKVGLLIIDLEAQYTKTIEHIEAMIEEYSANIELYWVCLPLSLRNAVSNFEPKWTCWDTEARDLWVRELPKNPEVITEDNNPFPFFEKGMEFEEFMVLFGEWYSSGAPTGGFVGIRADESLNRFRTIASKTKKMLNGKNYTTEVCKNLYNVYPIYDWKTQDIWHFHAVTGIQNYNEIYDYMYRANMSIHEMRLCQPYGDDQRRGLWLYHILEPLTWPKVVARVNGVTSGTLYIKESGNATGYRFVTKPDHHTWESYCRLLLATLPAKLKGHYQERFVTFMKGWKGRGYTNGIPDEAPLILEKKQWAPSWRRLCRVILRNDYWCKGLGFTQPKSEAYGKYLRLKKTASDNETTISSLDVNTETLNEGANL